MEKEMLMEVRVLCGEALTVRGHSRDVTVIPFTGEAQGPWFTGRVIGPGVDTQCYRKDGSGGLSARYLLEGRDREGRDCRVFVENEGNWEEGFRPRLTTDSPLLAAWETAALSATVEPGPDGVTVRIYKEE